MGQFKADAVLAVRQPPHGQYHAGNVS